MEWRLSGGERLLIVCRWICSTHAGSGLFGCDTIDIVCLLVLSRLCCTIGIVCGLPVGFRWSVEISFRTGLLKEQDGAVVGVFWPLSSVPASGPLSVLKYTLLALAATPLQQT